jgi:hypothetical protein
LTKSTHSFARRSRNLFAAFCVALAGNLFFLSYARAEDVVPAVTTIVTRGGDDVSYQIPLTVSVVFDGTTYQNVYATTNSVITFGRPDGTYWDYPVTPSISIESRDWWALPDRMPDTHFILNVSEGGFQVDGAYRPYGSMTGDVTSIVITAQIQTNGTVAYTYVTDGPLSGTERTGARLVDGTIVTLEQAGVTQVAVAPVLEPVPVPPVPVPEPPVVIPDPVPTPEPVPVPQPEPRPRPVFEPPVVEPEPMPVPVEEVPVLEPTPEPPVVEPEPEIVPEEPPAEEVPAEEPPVPAEEPPAPVEEPPALVEEAPPVVDENSTPEEIAVAVEALIASADGEAVTAEAIAEAGLTYSDLPPDTPVEVRTDAHGNEVIITAEVAAALEVLASPAEFIGAVFDDPAQALLALASIGADMSEEERKQSTETVLAAVIVGQIATQSAVAAAAGAAAASSTYRRKP